MTLEGGFKGYIGVFDSGVGGISVLKALTKELPQEDFLYYGDSANAPYGKKTAQEVQALSAEIADAFVGAGVKAIVIACNTATSAAAPLIRERYADVLPIIGVEPALKPAAAGKTDGRILVMATPVTLRLEKYSRLEEQLSGAVSFIQAECPDLVRFVEEGQTETPELRSYLEEHIGPYRGQVDGIVLGCTHYPFVKKMIREVCGDVPLYDGAEGTARELHRQLEKRGLLKTGTEPFTKPGTAGPAEYHLAAAGKGTVVFRSSLSSEEELRLYERLYRMPLD